MSYETIVLDTETTGFTKADAAPLSQQPYVTEFCGYKIIDREIVDKYSVLFRPPVPISEKITKLTGIDDELLDAEGRPFLAQLDDFKQFCKGADRWVAHNANFDATMIKLELQRCGHEFRFPWPIELYCTVERTFNIKGYRLKLSALYEHLFGETFKDAHRAEPDVIALTRCYLELTK